MIWATFHYLDAMVLTHHSPSQEAMQRLLQMETAQNLISAIDIYRSAYPAVQDYQESRVSSLCLSIFSFLLTVHRFVYGNFMLDFAVPTALLNMCSLRNEREFTHMQYSATTCDPNDFNLTSASYCMILRVEQCFSL